MRFVQWVSGFGVIFGLVGCGAATSEMSVEINRFQCRSADFSKIDAAVSKVLKKDADLVSSDARAYDLFEAFNAKLASKCGATVLEECSPSAMKVVRGNSILGPINSLGVHGNTEIRMVSRHDGLARSLEPQLYYRWSVNMKRFREGMDCFTKATR